MRTSLSCTLLITLALAATACRDDVQPTRPVSEIVPGVNVPPFADAGGPYDSRDGTVQFDGSRSFDLDGDVPLSYAWDFGDGSTGTGATPAHAYEADGDYAITLSVTDARGARSIMPAQASAHVANAVRPEVVVAAGNIASCGGNNDEATAQLLDRLPGTVLALGDNTQHGTAVEYASCYDPTWGRHKARTYAVLGNHEYVPGNADPTFDYYGDRAGPRGKGYYSFDLGAWHVIVLNDNATFVPFAAGSEQEQWLRQDLAASSKRCTLAVWHAPRFLSSSEAGFTERPTRKVLWDDLYAAGAELVLNAQEHHYERFGQLDPDGRPDAVRGIVEFNVGTGGESTAMPTVINPNSEARSADFGVLKLTLRRDGYDWEFVPVAGATFTDSGSGTCH